MYSYFSVLGLDILKTALAGINLSEFEDLPYQILIFETWKKAQELELFFFLKLCGFEKNPDFCGHTKNLTV